MFSTYITLIHVITGTICVLSGTTAFLSPKGRPVHRAAGKTFVATMLTSATSGAVLGLMEPERLLITAFAGVLAAYLVTTGWMAARGRDGRPGWREQSAFGVILLLAAGLIGLGVLATQSADGTYLGFTADSYFLLAIMSCLGLVSDLVFLARSSLPDRQRVARHLWRMGLAYFIAIGSLFTGPGAVVFPDWLRESGWLSAPEGVTVLAILFWLLRTLFNRPRPSTEPSS